MVAKTPVGLVGCGNISGTYMDISKRFQDIEIQAFADIIPERAISKCEKHGMGRLVRLKKCWPTPKLKLCSI
jgi:predicted dehydrogenase